MHTNSSSDSSISPRALIKALRAHPSVKCAIVTDHDTLKGYQRAKRLSKQYEEEVLIIPGIEVSTDKGHLTLLGVEEEPRGLLSPSEAVDFAQERDALVLIPHPFRSGTGIASNLKTRIKADAVEVFGPRFTKAEAKMSSTLAKLLKAIPVAGSDCHRVEEFATCYTCVNAATLGVDEILSALRLGPTRPVCTVRLRG